MEPEKGRKVKTRRTESRQDVRLRHLNNHIKHNQSKHSNDAAQVTRVNKKQSHPYGIHEELSLNRKTTGGYTSEEGERSHAHAHQEKAEARTDTCSTDRHCTTTKGQKNPVRV